MHVCESSKRSIYSDKEVKKNSTRFIAQSFHDLFVRKGNLNECSILPTKKTPIQHSKVNRQKSFCKRYMRLMLWSNIAPLEIFLYVFALLDRKQPYVHLIKQMGHAITQKAAV